MIRLGILGCSDIAFRRFMPAARKIRDIKTIAVAEEYNKAKLDGFCKEYNLEGGDSFEELIMRKDIDAVYVPLPPALHYMWAKRALECNKHVLVEKPSTVQYSQSKELVDLADQKKLALHENYMFQYHSQIREIKKMLSEGIVGDVRLIKANFGFPRRNENDFRYNKELGGGALLDAGGYTVKLAMIMLGDTIKVDMAKLNYLPDFHVDIYGSAVLSNSQGTVCQIGYGMDCAYQCSLEIWGSKGRLYTNRIFTAPEEYRPQIIVESGSEVRNIDLEPDSHFQHSIEQFLKEIKETNHREEMHKGILLQAKLVDDIRRLGAN